MNQPQTHLEQRTVLKEGHHTNHPFPKDMVSMLRCNEDAGELAIVKEERVLGDGIMDARLRCNICGSEFHIEDGIVRLLPRQLSSENQHEMNIRDSIDYDCTNPGSFIPPADGWRSVLSDKLEVPAHLKELRVSQSNTVLELACGDGRFTSLIAETGPRVLAVDFSINALLLLAHRLPAGARVGRVHADINHLHFASRSFDRAISLTPLDSRDERMAMYRMVAHSLTDDGRYVASVEHDDLNRRLLGLPRVRRYSRDGILIEHLSMKTMRSEAAPYFTKLRIRPIRPRVPLVAKLPRFFALAILSTVATLPLVRQFGDLLLLTARRPVRLPIEGEYRQSSWMAKRVYRLYMRLKNQKPSWGEEPVGSTND
jgi:SAM-dependent methyltransferase